MEIECAAVDLIRCLVFDEYRLDLRAGGLFREGENGGIVRVALGSRALDVLTLLLERCGDLLTKEEIFAAVWPKMVVDDSNITVQISALRRVLDQGRATSSYIQTVSGHGYRFVGSVKRQPAIITTPNVLAYLIPRLSIVVLPFANLSNDLEQQYFADAITEDLTSDLSRIPDSFVISCNTAFTYRNRRIDTRQIGRELAVRYVLEGSVRRSGDHIRINAQLIDAEKDAHLWADRFDGGTSDILALQDEITRRIAVTLSLELVRAEAARPTPHPDALEYILRGRAASTKPRSRDNYVEMIDLFERALALDPESIEAQSRLAGMLAGRVMDNMTDTAAEDMTRAEDLTAGALAMASHNSLAHYARGQLLRAQRRFTEAAPQYEAALASNRNWLFALFALSQCKAMTGSIQETIPLMEQAIRLSPRDPLLGSFFSEIGRAHLLQSRTDEAIPWLEKARDTTPARPGFRAWLASAYALKGEAERSTAELAEARRLSSGNRFTSIVGVKEWYWTPAIGAALEATFLAGLRKAGMPEE